MSHCVWCQLAAPFACRRFNVQDAPGLCVRHAKAIDPVKTPRGDEGAALNRFGEPGDNGGGLNLVGNAANAKDDDEGDLRTTLLQEDDLGRRNKPWNQVALESSQHRFDDFPKELHGSPQAINLSQNILGLGGPHVFFAELCKSLEIDRTDRLARELKAMLDVIFYAAGIYDQLNMGALASVEAGARRVIQLVEANKNGFGSDWNTARHVFTQFSPTDLMTKDFRQDVNRRAKEDRDVLQFRSLATTSLQKSGVGEASEAGGLPPQHKKGPSAPGRGRRSRARDLKATAEEEE